MKETKILAFFMIIGTFLFFGNTKTTTPTDDSFHDEEKIFLEKVNEKAEKKFDYFLEKRLVEVKNDKEKIPVIILLEDSKEKNLQHIKNAILSEFSGYESEVSHVYSIINGFSAKIQKRKLIELKKNPNIKKIWYDKEVRVFPLIEGKDIGAKVTNSRKIIDAETVWNLGYSGNNVTVAVIDTGIDYTHKDLGNCTQAKFLAGNCSKVIGGYDFVNSDPNPIDDNGHGTHCAGIAGANGTIQGVAPGAKFLAVKVLDSSGSGTSSGVIAGIEWAVLNNASILSLSLGGNKQPNDGSSLLDQIIDNVTEQYSVVVVIAAGNEGPGTGTIAYPADSKKAITVGASNGASNVVDFSNRGPSAFGRLDPEVVAPGVNIESTWLGGGYQTKSGTSMSTPHVSGAAALLLSWNRNLTPQEIRGILMHSSNNISGHEFEKGAGIINVTRAIISNIRIKINGDDRLEAEVFSGERKNWTLFLENKRNQSLNFTFDIGNITDLESRNPISKEQFSFPSSLTLANNSNASLTINFSAPQNAKPNIYGGTFIVRINNSNEFRVPIVITIPFLYNGFVDGTVDDDCLGSDCGNGLEGGGDIIDWGDWLYYKLKTNNGSITNMTLLWENDANDLNFYLLSSNGILINYSAAGSGNSEEIFLNATEETYWMIVRNYYSLGIVPFNLTVTSISELNVTLLLPENGSLLRENVTFIYNVSSSSEISNCSLYGNFSSGIWKINQTNNNISIGTNSFFVRLDDGKYKWNVECKDNSPESLGKFAQENWTLEIDNSPPNILLQKPENGSTIQGSMRENFSIIYTEAHLNKTLFFIKNSTAENYSSRELNCSSGINQSCSTILDLSNFAHNSSLFYFFMLEDLLGMKINSSVYSLQIDKQIFINEFFPNPSSGQQEWIELYNNGLGEVNLSNWFLNTTMHNYVISNKTISSKNWLVFYQHEMNLTLNDSADEIHLLDFSGNLVDNISYRNNETFSGNYTYNSTLPMTIGRTTDGASMWRTFSPGTPGSKNGDIFSVTIFLNQGWNLISVPLEVI